MRFFQIDFTLYPENRVCEFKSSFYIKLKKKLSQKEEIALGEAVCHVLDPEIDHDFKYAQCSGFRGQPIPKDLLNEIRNIYLQFIGA